MQTHMLSITRLVHHAMKNGVSTGYYATIRLGTNAQVRIPEIMRRVCVEEPMVIVAGVLIGIYLKTFNASQNEKIMNPAKRLEHMKKMEEAKATEAPTTTTIDDKSPEGTRAT